MDKHAPHGKAQTQKKNGCRFTRHLLNTRLNFAFTSVLTLNHEQNNCFALELAFDALMFTKVLETDNENCKEWDIFYCVWQLRVT